MHDLAFLDNAIWLMDRDRLASMARRLAVSQGWPTAAELRQAQSEQNLAAGKLRQVRGKVAVLPIQGIVEHRMGAMGWFFGGFSTEAAELALEALLANREAEAIVLDVDSPGGTSYGVEEFADLVYEMRGKKKMVAVANSMAASAAYWIASAAESLYVTPSGDVGSIGVYALHADLSAALVEEGVKVTVAKAGKYKTEFNPYEPLSPEPRDYMQEMVDDTYGKFVKGVARNRKMTASVVRGPDFGEGRIVPAYRAKAAGMVDRVATLSQVLAQLTGGQGAIAPGGGRTDIAASVEVLRLRHAQRKRVEVLA